MIKDQQLTIVATCTFGLELVLKREFVQLGYTDLKGSEGAVSIQGTFEDVYRLNLWLRTANRVMIEIADFPALSFDELYDQTTKISWENYLPKNAKFNVTKISSSKSKLFSKSDSQRIIKKAIVDRLSKVYRMQRLPETGAYYQLSVNIKKNNVKLFLNTSGESLHRRGYRLSAGEAPIKETLAAGIIMLSGYKGEQEFADVMCGSGTFVIEAALIASNTPPGLNRTFAFEEWGVLDSKTKETILDKAKSEIRQPEHRLLGSDIDPGVLKTARKNVQRADMQDFCSFQKLDFREFRSRKKHGVLICNPPYGERIGKFRETERLYKDLRAVYDQLDEWTLFVLTGNEEFQKCFGKTADRNRKLYNGNMLTYLYQYFPSKE